MLIECILKRDGGTKVELEGDTYHFRPTDLAKPDTSPHVAEVKDYYHAERLLNIPEAYQQFDEVAAPVIKPSGLVVSGDTNVQIPPKDDGADGGDGIDDDDADDAGNDAADGDSDGGQEESTGEEETDAQTQPVAPVARRRGPGRPRVKPKA